jgi:serralysin
MRKDDGMTDLPSAFEQELLELINRARMYPGQEAAALIPGGRGVVPGIDLALRQYDVSIAAFQAAMAAYDPQAPLAWSMTLGRAAEFHSTALVRAKALSTHQLPGEPDTVARIQAEGDERWQYLRENVYSQALGMVQAHGAFLIDWGYGPGGMQDPAGHRLSIMRSVITEVGISVEQTSGRIGPHVVTQDFGHHLDYRPQLVGVVFDDGDGDRFYDAGEGLGGITVTATGAAGTYVTTTWGAGGYQMELPAGSYTVTFSGGGLGGVVSSGIVFGTANLKLDALADDARPAPDPHRILGTPDADTLAGTTGDDTLLGGGGRDRLAGGPGGDTILAEPSDPGADAVAGQIWRLYQAVLGRAPDAAGLAGWVDRLAGDAGPAGASRAELNAAAQGFAASAEFQARYGGLSDAAFVSLLYRNVLDRAPDAAGLAAWTAKLARGADRAEVVTGFSESAEFVADSLPDTLRLGLAGRAAAAADDVFRLYQAVLDRTPDWQGLQGWSQRIAEGRSLQSVAEGFVGSAEFQARYGGLPDAAFVSLLYRNVLDRAPDAAGLAAWTAKLARGADRAEVVLKFSQSPELIGKSAAAVADWMQARGGDDRIEGGAGDNVLAGGIGADTFVFVQDDGGRHHIADPEPWDRIELRGFGYDGFDDVMAHVTGQGGNAVFSDQGVTIILHDIPPATLDPDMFSFF